MPVSPFNTPLRYPGGKGRLTRYVAQLIEVNGLQDGSYVEAYAGGAGLAVSLLFSERVRTIHLNDISRPIYSFWKSVLDYADELCRLISNTPVNLDEWYRQRSVQDAGNDNSDLELGFSTFFLNRVNRSGIIRGGVIGGKNQSGAWKIDARYKKEDLIKRIKKIARYRNRIRLYSMDAADFIQTHIPIIGNRSFIYLDPPYYVKGGGLYEHKYTPEDHEQIANLAQTVIRQRWIVSYDNHPEIKKLYRERRQQTFNLHYSANRRFQGSELMIFSDRLKIPKEIVPSRSTAA